ncbi:MAG TPA: hypothetical protein VIH90_00300 [Candidatus Saccharimonadales bacterium]
MGIESSQVKSSLSMKIKQFTLLFCFVALFSLAISFINSPKAHADIWPPANLYNFTMPGGGTGPGTMYYTYLHCDTTLTNPSLWSPMISGFISPVPGAPTATTINVNYGQASIPLEYYHNAATCIHSGGSVIDQTDQIVGSSTLRVTGIAGTILTMHLGAGSPVGTYQEKSQVFNYAPPGGFTTVGSTTYTVELDTKDINWFPAAPNFRCYGNPIVYASSEYDFNPCSITPVYLSFQVNVLPPTPTFTNVSGTVRNSTTSSGYANVKMYSCLGSEVAYNPGYPARIVDMAMTPSGDGYYLLQADGGVFAFGDAVYSGGTNTISGVVGSPVGISASPDGRGYAIVTTAGGVYAFGGAPYYKTPGTNIDPISISYAGTPSGISYTPSSNGYAIVTTAGAVYAFGLAPGYGNASATSLTHGNVVGIAYTRSGYGYYFVHDSGYIDGQGDVFYFYTNSSGNYTFPIADNQGYCVRITPPGPTGATLHGPILDSDYIPPSPPGIACVPPNFGAYEWQVSNGYHTTASPCQMDLTHDGGLNFIYTNSAAFSCVTLSATPSPPQTGQPLALNMNVINNVAGSGNINITSFTWHVTDSLGTYNATGTGPRGAYGPSVYVLATDNIPSANTSVDTYTATWVVKWAGNPIGLTCTGPVSTTVVDYPFMKVYGGDVFAGVSFDSSPVASTSSGIYSTDRLLSSGSYQGSSTEQGAFATALVSGFGSYKNNTSNGTDPPSDLTFANTPAVGNFGNPYPVTDYYSQLINSSAVPVQTGTKLSTILGSGNQVLGLGDRHIILVTGDFYIDDNVSYSSSLSGATLANMPMLYIVDKGGNIYIDGNVTNLAGVFIDEPVTGFVDNTSPNGNIYDCATPATFTHGADPNSSITSDCGNPLVVNGSFMAGNIDFQRVSGQSGLSDAASAVTNGSDNCSNPDAQAAEVFCYSPLTWLANPYKLTYPSDYISSVPPTL